MPEWKEEIVRRLAPLKLAPTREAEIVDELSQHLEDRYQELLASGQSQDAAFHAALDELKGEDPLAYGLKPVEKTFCHEPIVPGKATGNVFEGIGQDIRYAFRILRKSPGFTAVAILTLALGIGVNTAIFTVMDATLLRPLPYKQPAQLVMVWGTQPGNGHRGMVFSSPNFLDLKDQNRVFANMAAFDGGELTLSDVDVPENITVGRVTPDFFKVLQVQPALGRVFLPDEGQAGREQVVILSYALWRQRFASAPAIVGKMIQLNGTPYAVVGVLPRILVFPFLTITAPRMPGCLRS